jgi:hypothetical protein
MLFVDGWHDTEAVLTDWLSWKDKLAEGTIIVVRRLVAAARAQGDHGDREVSATLYRILR